jgi:hypothetical protein
LAWWATTVVVTIIPTGITTTLIHSLDGSKQDGNEKEGEEEHGCGIHLACTTTHLHIS